jgi:hypothetical protein
MPVNLDESLLGKLLGVCRISNQPQDNAVNSLVIFLEKLGNFKTMVSFHNIPSPDQTED